MTYSTKILEIINSLKFYLQLESTKVEFGVHFTDFSRTSGKLNFYNYALLGISLLKNSLAIELYNVLSVNDLNSITKSAYSQARYKIVPSLYQSLNCILLHSVYTSSLESDLEQTESCSTLLKWRGYFLEAVDGTCITLPQNKEVGEHFGWHRGGSKKKPSYTAMARCLLRADLLNGFILQSEVFKTSGSELSICKKWLHELNSESISIFDRGFASATIFSYLVTYNKPFVTRLKVSFNNVVKNFVVSDCTDKEVYFTVHKTEIIPNGLEIIDGKEVCRITCIKKGTPVKLRLVKVVLPSGEVEILATNLMDKIAITLLDLSELYNQRWGIETVIDSLKNQLLLMVFSGLKPAAILQDLYASFFVYNFRQVFINEAQKIVNQQVEEKEEPQYEQKINKNVAIGILKWKIITLFLLENPEQIIVELVVVFAQNKIPKVKDKKKPPRNKSLAKRRNLVTQKNYRKAI
jgi:hypothetical protein